MQIAEFMYQPIRQAVDWIIAVINSMIRGFNSVFGMLGLHINEIGWKMPTSLFGGEEQARVAPKVSEAEQQRADIRAAEKARQKEDEEARSLREKEQARLSGRDIGAIRWYQHGGPILGPTALTSLRTGQTYAIAGERGPESVVAGGQSANIHVYLDGELIADKVGARLVNKIKLQQGVMP